MRYKNLWNLAYHNINFHNGHHAIVHPPFLAPSQSNLVFVELCQAELCHARNMLSRILSMPQPNSLWLILEKQNYIYVHLSRLASVAGAVIQAIGRPEFEDGLRTGVLLEDC